MKDEIKDGVLTVFILLLVVGIPSYFFAKSKVDRLIEPGELEQLLKTETDCVASGLFEQNYIESKAITFFDLKDIRAECEKQKRIKEIEKENQDILKSQTEIINKFKKDKPE